MNPFSQNNHSSAVEGSEISLLRLCARVNPGDAAKNEIVRIAASELDWKLFYELCCAHKVRPLVHHTLKSLAAAAVPKEVSQALALDFLLNAQKNWNTATELTAIARRFADEKKIDVMPIKGPALALSAYRDLSLRQSKDLDIIVKTRDVQAASAILLDMGYRVPDQVNADEHRPMYKDPHFMESASSLRQYEFHRADGMLVELHWEMGPRYFPFALNNDKIWEQAVPGEFMDTPVYTLSTEIMFLLLVDHGSKHGWLRHAWIVDIAEYLRENPNLDWAAVTRSARAFGMTIMVALALRLASDFSGAAVPAGAAGLLVSHPRVENLYRRVDEAHRDILSIQSADPIMHYFGMNASDRLLDRIRYGSSILTTPTIEEWTRIKLPERFTGLYRGVRLLRVAAMLATGKRNG